MFKSMLAAMIMTTTVVCPVVGVAQAGSSPGMEFSFWNLADYPNGMPCASGSGDVNYDWGAGHPGTCDDNDFNGLGRGFFRSPVTGTVEFCGVMDDWLRVAINTTILFATISSDCATIDLVDGQCYEMNVAFNEYSGNANFKVTWSWPSHSATIMRTEDFVASCYVAPKIDLDALLERQTGGLTPGQDGSDLPGTL